MSFKNYIIMENLHQNIDFLAAGKWKKMDPQNLKNVIRQYIQLLGQDHPDQMSDPFHLNTVLELEDLIKQWKVDPRLSILKNDLETLELIVKHDVDKLNSMAKNSNA